jgi:DNA-binding transcriptional LysR family regulator
VDFRQLQYFAAAVEQRSISSAARACRVAQPTLSSQVRRLELELNEALFGRTAVGLRPTKRAQSLYRRLSPLLDDATHGFRYIRSRNREPIETLQVEIGYSAASLIGLLARNAARLVEAKHPHLRIALQCSEMGRADPSAPAAEIRVRHALKRRKGAAVALSDVWLLVEVAGRRRRRRTAVASSGPLPGDCVVELPALPDDIKAALADWPGIPASTSLEIGDDEAIDLVAAMLARNHGVALLPRLAISPITLRHPRLRVREIAVGLPGLSVIVEARNAKDNLQRAYCEEMAAGSAKLNPTAPIASLPDARSFRYFLCAYDEGCVTRAATKLNVVQPAVSMQIRTLERKLGGRLFERTRHGVHPTPFGRQVRTIYGPILEALQMEARRSSAGRPQTRPILRVGLMPGLDDESLLVKATTATIVEWQDAFANVELKVVEAHSGVLLDWLIENVVDVAIVEDMHAHTALKQIPLCSEPLAVLTSARLANCPPGPIKMRDIGKLRLVLPSMRHGLRALLSRRFAAAGLPLVPKLELDSMAAAVRLVKAGGWATVLPPSSVRRSLDGGVLQAHPIVEPQIMRELRSVQLPRHPIRPWERVFIRLLCARFSSQLGV